MSDRVVCLHISAYLFIRHQETMLMISPHENVTLLYGIVLEPMSLIVEFCDGGALDSVLGISPVCYDSCFIVSSLCSFRLCKIGFSRSAPYLFTRRMSSACIGHCTRRRSSARLQDNSSRFGCTQHCKLFAAQVENRQILTSVISSRLVIDETVDGKGCRLWNVTHSQRRRCQ